MNEQRIESIRVDRPLTDQERTLTQWMLENGDPEAVSFVEQLERARVIGHCSCGCATVDFAIDGMPDPPAGVHILGDFLFGGETAMAGVFVFEAGGILKGLEVYGFTADAPRILPKPSDLRPFQNSK